MDFDITDKATSKSPKAPIDGRLKAMSYRNSIGTGVDSSGVKGQLGDVMVEGLRTSIAARAALGTLLLVTHRCPSYLSRESWQVMWILLALLRDCSLLPACMIVVDTGSSGDTDLLPEAYRTEFEVRLLASDRREVDTQLRLRNRLNPVSPYVKKSSSLLSLQGAFLLPPSLHLSLFILFIFSLPVSHSSLSAHILLPLNQVWVKPSSVPGRLTHQLVVRVPCTALSPLDGTWGTMEWIARNMRPDPLTLQQAQVLQR